MGSTEKHINVFVTGFGPFEGHPVNASWEAVKELSKRDFPNGVKLHIKDIPVDYAFVKEEIPKLERDCNANLIVHVGVSGFTQCLQIEQCAHSDGYQRDDITGCTPDESEIIPECLKTPLDISELRMYCDKFGCSCHIEPSENAGRYLCEFIYYTSLKANIAPALFVHVPCLDLPYSKEELANALKFIILAALNQIENNQLRS